MTKYCSRSFARLGGFFFAAFIPLSFLRASLTPVVENDWRNGAQVRVDVVNDTGATLEDWRAEFTLSRTIGSIWSSSVESHDGDRYVIQAPNWNRTLAPGAKTSFGFVVNPGSVTPASFTNLVLRAASDTGGGGNSDSGTDTGDDSSSGSDDGSSGGVDSGPETTVTIGDITIAFTVTTDWGSGYTGNFAVTNNGPAVSNWALDFTLPATIGNFWNATLASHGNGSYTATPPSWSNTLAAGGTLNIGFNASPGKVTSAPTGITFNGASGSSGNDNSSGDDGTADGGTSTTPEDPTDDGSTADNGGSTGEDPVTDDGRSGDANGGVAGSEVPILVGYFAEWGIYDRNYFVDDIPADKLNVINYAFADTQNGEVVLFDSWAAVEIPFAPDTWNTPLPRGNMGALKRLKEANPHLKTMISIGGWTLSDEFSDIALTDATRQKFAASAVAFMRTYGFDGIDIDWEYPGGGGLAGNSARSADKQNFTLLLAEVRRQLDIAETEDGTDYFLTIAAPAGLDKIANIEPANIAAICDWINVMTYDFHGAWENVTGHNAPLVGASAGDQLNVTDAVQAYLDAGVPASKLTLGMGFYGRGWSGVPATNNGLYQSGYAAPGTFETGMYEYWDIVRLAADAAYTKYRDPVSEVPFLYAPSINGGTWITYDDPESLARKVDFLREKGMGGAMIWELSGDVRDGGDDSLLNVVSEKLFDQ